MKSLGPLLSIIALGCGLFGCAAKEEVPVAGTATAAPYGVAGIAYSAALASTCSTVPLPWTVSSGAVPGGLIFDGATGDVTGTPAQAAAGNSTVVFAGKDSTGKTETCAVLFVVHPRTDRVSVDTNGFSVTGATNREPSISKNNGRFIVFTSSAPLIPGVTGQQIYMHDRQTGQPSLVSRDNSAALVWGNASSSAPSISADGRFVAFVSTATNLVPVAVSGPQIYLRDTVGNVTSLVSQDNSGGQVAGNASSSTPSISGDGKFVAFVSSSTNLVAEVVAGTVSHVYIRDILANQTSLVSRDNSVTPVPGNASSSTPSISTPIIGDRPVVAFVSLSTNLVVGVTDGTHVYVRNIQTNQTRLVSQDNSYVAAVPGVPVPGNGPSSTPAISEDGRFVAFTSQAMNLLLPTTVQTVTAGQVYVRDTDIQANQTRLVSQDNIGVSVPFPGNGLSSTPSISADGQFVAFVSSAPNLVTSPAPAAAFDVYVRAVP